MAEAPPFAADRLVTLANWQQRPYNRWAFQHVRELIPSARIRRSDGPAWRLPRDERDLSAIRFRAGGREMTVEQLLEHTWTDGFLVLHRGRIVTERYFNGMSPDTPHLLMSISKSVTSTIGGVLVGRGALDVSSRVTDVVPDLTGTSFEGTTVQHLLDMRAGTKFDETYDDPEADVRVYEQVYLWRPRDGRPLPADALGYFATLRNDGEHGGAFRYRSILSDVLAWMIERATGSRLHELIARELWKPMGAEFDAENHSRRTREPDGRWGDLRDAPRSRAIRTAVLAGGAARATGDRAQRLGRRHDQRSTRRRACVRRGRRSARLSKGCALPKQLVGARSRGAVFLCRWDQWAARLRTRPVPDRRGEVLDVARCAQPELATGHRPGCARDRRRFRIR
jgi:CubicO group peptidase (beta-lactamase class C family)